MLDRFRSLGHFFATYWQHLPLAKEAIFTFRCELCLIKGRLRNGGTVVTVLYTGRTKNKAYLLEQFFDQIEILQHQHTKLIRFNRCLISMEGLADVIINDIGWPYSLLYSHQKRYLEVPDWINMGLDLADSWPQVVQDFRHSTRNNDLRLIRRNNYHAEFTNDPAEVDIFYEHFYLPFMQHTHGAAAVIASKAEVARRARKGGLLKVQADSETVAAGVVYTDNFTLCFLWLGIPQSRLQAPAEAAISALYYFGIKHAFDNQCKAVDFAGSRAFMIDGGYRFKRKWGAILEDTFSPSAVLIRPQSGNTEAVAFCEAVPTLARINGKLVVRIVTSAEDVDQAFVARYWKEMACPGIDALSFIQLGNRCYQRTLPSQVATCETEHIEVDLEHFSDAYVNSEINYVTR